MRKPSLTCGLHRATDFEKQGCPTRGWYVQIPDVRGLRESRTVADKHARIRTALRFCPALPRHRELLTESTHQIAPCSHHEIAADDSSSRIAGRSAKLGLLPMGAPGPTGALPRRQGAKHLRGRGSRQSTARDHHRGARRPQRCRSAVGVRPAQCSNAIRQPSPLPVVEPDSNCRSLPGVWRAAPWLGG